MSKRSIRKRRHEQDKYISRDSLTPPGGIRFEIGIGRSEMPASAETTRLGARLAAYMAAVEAPKH